ncbi:MAG TPA: PilN domain-containing protein [Dongiaceae bacterium]|nr:PilN domain-containing protein [Dongiaceae bacterium]
MAELEQRINFYQDIFRKPEIRYSFRQLILVLASVAALMAMLVLADYVRTGMLRQHLAQMQTTQERLDKSVTAMTEQLAKMVPDSALQQQETYLQESLQAKYQFLAQLRSQGDSHQVHFSEVLAGLSALSMDSLWLTRIQIQSPGPQLSLTGLTLKPRALPDYLAALNQEPVFAGMSFRMLDLERAEQDSRYMTFNVSTRHESKLER